MNKVKAQAQYRFDPVGWDRVDPPIGVIEHKLNVNDIVRVVNLPGCPRANTMGHCHIETPDGQYLGLVSCGSLHRRA